MDEPTWKLPRRLAALSHAFEALDMLTALKAKWEASAAQHDASVLNAPIRNLISVGRILARTQGRFEEAAPLLTETAEALITVGSDEIKRIQFQVQMVLLNVQAC